MTVQDLSTMGPLIGRWATTITMLHPPEAKREHYHAVDTYRWMSGRAVVLHEVQALMPDGPMTALEVYTVGPEGIVSRSFDSSGAVSDYRASMQGGIWHVEGAAEKFASTSITGESIQGLWQLKVDDRWVDWMTVQLDRVASD